MTPPCASAVHTAVVPAWARAGFSAKRPRMPLALGRSGRIVAIVFGHPLLSPPAKTRSNKILWVAHPQPNGYTTLRITAQRMTGTKAVGKPVQRTVAGGPGPSIVDLPAPGCWRLTLRWAGRADQVDLAYARRS
ncbi:MAG TPA: hypothetical protein VHB30_14250 [Solirubrobacteraceae bacterium]|nr:hypothetical protein [Solirubrobacteraceae bacterium]